MSKLLILISATGGILSACPVAAETYDLVIYGSSPAAVQAIDTGCAVQDLPYPPLARRLLADGQVLAFKAPR